MFKTILLIGTGGFAGTVSRYLLSKLIAAKWPMSFPWGTFSVNILGCFLIGIVMGLSFQSSVSTQTRLLLATGFCGGFTTFSTYSLEIFELYQRGEAGIGMLYLFASILLGLTGVWLGLWAARVVFQN
ncbi:MAG TPA: fluoride efflux transporter CrcB [Halalkalibaculum sp.]|nr:fluoride efflux transporter CrcB [Halalkalibaculum sp.]